MNIYMYLVAVVILAVCGMATNWLFSGSFFPEFSREGYWTLSLYNGTGGAYQSSQHDRMLFLSILLTFVAAALIFWRIPLNSPLDRILAVASVPATGVAIFIALRFLAVVCLVAVCVLVGAVIYKYVKTGAAF